MENLSKRNNLSCNISENNLQLSDNMGYLGIKRCLYSHPNSVNIQINIRHFTISSDFLMNGLKIPIMVYSKYSEYSEMWTPWGQGYVHIGRF